LYEKIKMPIERISEYVELSTMGDSTLQERYNMILEQKQNVLNQISELKDCLKEFEYKDTDIYSLYRMYLDDPEVMQHRLLD